MLKIKFGSVFDDKCDLLILPCNDQGGVTGWVRHEIEQHHLPFWKQKIPHGEVFFSTVQTLYEKADCIGYAASVSVATGCASLEAITRITQRIGRFRRDNDCSQVNLPLLGVGAGGLAHADVMACYQAQFAEDPGRYTVFIPDRQLADRFLAHIPASTSANGLDEHPRVFLSYSHKDPQVKAWVVQLACRLRENGVDARLDHFHLKPGMDVPQWMTNELIKARRVLLVCDVHYAEKADMRKAGVGWETMIIQGDMLVQGEQNSKYIVISVGDFEQNTPIYMKSRLAMPQEQVDADITGLLELIFEVDVAPELGPVPEWLRQRQGANKA